MYIQGEVKPASTFANFISRDGIDKFRNNHTLDFIDGHILWHRDHHNGNHVTLYYPGFAIFSHDCDTISVDRNDCAFALEICQKMCKFYACDYDEKCRVKDFKDTFETYLGCSVAVNHKNIDISILPGPCVILKAKREVGATNCDSLVEAVSYYIQQVDKNNLTSPRPCFLIELVGPHLIISGATIGKNVLIDRLTRPIWLVVQPMDSSEMVNIARVFKSLKKAIDELKRYYNNKSTLSSYNGYPVFTTFRKDEQEYTIKYIKEIKPQVFEGKLQGPRNFEKEVIIKFTERYGKDVHHKLSQYSYAPELFYCEKFEETRFFVVVMEKIPCSIDIDDFLKERPEFRDQIISKCSKALEIMRQNNYCHGDFRSSNILVDSDANVKVIDFDWAGIEGETKYPYFMNHVNITWPETATDGANIHIFHDEYWLNKLK